MSKKYYVLFLSIIVSLFAHSALAECDLSMKATTPTTRFVLKKDQFYDRETGLTWQRCSVGMHWEKNQCHGEVALMSLPEAKEKAKSLGGGWRVPNIDELGSLIEARCTYPSVNTEILTDIHDMDEGSPYWSQTAMTEIPGFFYYINFIDGSADGHSEGFYLGVRLVKGPLQ